MSGTDTAEWDCSSRPRRAGGCSRLWPTLPAGLAWSTPVVTLGSQLRVKDRVSCENLRLLARTSKPQSSTSCPIAKQRLCLLTVRGHGEEAQSLSSQPNGHVSVRRVRAAADFLCCEKHAHWEDSAPSW
eukprot:3540442-Rhodomonas_salina.5